MNHRGILADTCAWIEYFRPGTSQLEQRLEQSLSEGAVHACGPVLCELVQGARSEKEQVQIVHALSALPFLEMTESLWIKAGQLSASLRKTGKTIPFSDILIAAIALEHQLAILTVDTHFRDIPGLTLDPMDPA